jgi:hypothetical protein
MPSLQSLPGQVTRSGCIASVQKSLCANLANPFDNQGRFVLPHAGDCYTADIKVHILHAWILSLDCFYKYRQSFVDCRVIIAAAPGKMCDLNSHIRSLGEELFQENASFLCPIRAMVIDVRMHVNCNCHAVPIGRAKHLTHPGEVFRIINIHVRITEVQLESSAQVRILRAACDLLYCIGPQRIDAAKPH